LNLPASGLKKVQLKDGLNQEKLKVLSYQTINGQRGNVLCWILLGEMFVDKLLIVRAIKPEFNLSVTKNSNIVKNPIPILWNFNGIYGWIPVEIIINEIERFLYNEKVCPGLAPAKLYFNWHQTYRLRPDIGKMLEELASDRV